jgi:hypothetical protein
VTVESETRPPDSHSYLVTARHNIDNAKREGSGKIFVRLNKYPASPEAPVSDSELRELTGPWWYHGDEVNDVAVTRFNAPQLYLTMTFERAVLAAPEVIERENIGIGDELVVVGLFSSHAGKEINIPIVRSGSIASMDFEQVQDVNTGELFDAYLAEVRSIGGLSGSPVWVIKHPGQYGTLGSQRKLFLLGCVRGHWRKDEEWLSDFSDSELDSINTGIAMVTPIQKAVEIIDSDELRRERREEDRIRAARQPLSEPSP